MIPQDLITSYLGAYGLLQACLGTFEIIGPARSFRIMKSWVSHKLFFIHGIVMIATAFPLTLYKGNYSTGIIIIGFAVTLTGPFILLFPDKLRESFNSTFKDITEQQQRSIITLDACIRIFIGGLCLTGFSS